MNKTWISRIVLFWRGRLLLMLLAALIAGIAAAALAISLWWLAALLAPLFFFCLLRRRLTAALLLLAVLLGFLLTAGALRALAAWPATTGETLTMTGRVIGAPQTRTDGYRLTVRPQTLNGAPLRCAEVYVYLTDAATAPPAGSIVAIDGRAYAPAGYANANAFDYGAYLQRQGIAGSVYCPGADDLQIMVPGARWRPANLGFWLRGRLNAAAAELPASSQALLFGVLLGDKSELDF